MKKFLFLFAALLAFFTNMKAQVEPVNDGVYYLYNEEADLFLARGANWGTRAVAMPVGMPWKVNISDGKWTLHMYDLGNPGYGGDGYADNGSPVGFDPSGSSETGYTLQYGDNYITCPNTAGPADLTATVSVWKFLTQAQYEAQLASRAKAQEAAVAEAKGIIIPLGGSLATVVSDPDNWTSATTDDGVPTNSTWSTSQNRGGTLNWGGYGSEMYQSAGHYTRTITGLKPGIYKVAVRAMKRVGSNGSCYTMGEAGYPVSDAYLTANGNIIPIKAWYEDCVSNGNPNNTGDFVNIVNKGGYTNEGFVYVDNSGELSLNAASEAYWNGCWFLFNGISYTFYNNEVSDEDAAAIIATAETTLEKKMGDLYSQAITEAKTTFEAAKTIANYNALNAAITNAAVSIASYAIIAAGSVSDNSLDGWTCENSNTFHINTWSTEGNSDGSNMKTPFIENWVAKGSYLGAGRVYYQLSGLNPGEVYYAQALVRSYNEANADAPNGPNFFINDKVVDMTTAGTTFTYNNMSGIYATLGGAAQVGEDGTLTLGVSIAENRNYNWVAFKSISIRPMQAALDEAREAANAQLGKIMNNDVAHALALALENYGTGTPSTVDEYVTAIEALESATEAAAASVANYEEAATIISAATTLDEAGQAVYNANEKVLEVKSLYDNKTLVAVTDEQKTACAAALATAVKAQTTEGSDWTLAIVNNSFETGNFSGWTNNGMEAQGNDSFAKDGNYYVEKWQPNGTFSVSQTITDLPRGTYRVSAITLARGVTSAKLFANDAEMGIEVSNDATIYSVDATLLSPGNLTIGFEGIGTGADASWLCVDNFTMSLIAIPDPTPYRVAVAAKLETAQGLVNEVMNADVATALSEAIAATAGYEESTDIDALEQMVTNLEAANAAAQTSIANYQEAVAIINAAITLDEAGQAVYNSNNKVLEVKAGYENKTLVAVTEEQKDVCKDALKVAVKAQTTDGADWTLLIDNADLEGSYTSVYNPSADRDIYQPEGWTAFWEYGDANDMTSLNSTCTSWNQFENMAQPADGGNNVYWARYRWGSQSSITLKQTISSLPAGLYEFGAEGYLSNATDGKATLSVKFGDEVALVDFTAAEWTKKSVSFSISEAQDVEILYNFTESKQTEIKAGVDNFTLTSRAIADADDYAALNAAIETAEAKKLGFKVGEYAPYTNVGVLSPLAAAKAIDQTAVNAKSAVVIATSLLNGAQSAWVENTEDMSIVYNGTFVASVNDGAPAGWETDNAAGLGGALHARAFVLNPGDNNYDKLVSFEQGDATRSAFYVRFDGTNSSRTTDYTYGETAGYTMPLEAGVYRVKLMAGGWGKTQPLNVKFEDADGIIKGEQVVEMTNIADDSGAAASFNFLSEVEAGDYKLVVSNGNIEADNAAAISNVEITLEMTATELAALREEIILLRTKVEGYTELPEPLATEAAAAVAEAYGYINEHECDPALLNTCKARLQAVVDAYEEIQATAAAYDALKSALDSYAAKVAALDADGQAAFGADAIYAGIEAKSYTKDEAIALKDGLPARYIAAVKAQTTPGSDMTELINNWDFVGCSNFNFPAWTLVYDGGNAWAHGATAVEYWNNNLNANFDYYQILTEMPAGKYSLSASMWNTQGTVTGESGVYATSSGATVFAGVTDDCGDADLHTYSTDVIVVTDGTLRLGVKNNAARKANWFGVDWIKLTYQGAVDIDDYYATIAEKLNEAQGLMNSVMSAAAETDLTAAVASTEGYTEITDIAVLQGMIDGLTTANAAAQISVHSYAVIASGVVPDNSLDGWVCENTNTFHINTWSTEGNSDGSNMKTPFIENWVGKGSYLGAGKVYYQLQGLNPGEVYYAQALVRSYNEANADAPNGPNFFINDKVVDMTEEGTTFTYNNMSGIYATLGGAATVGEDGILKLGVEIAENRNYNWVAFKSISIRPMQAALDEARVAANALVGKKMNNDVAHALALALEAYGTGTPTTAEEYEEAIAALSIATANAQASVDAYTEGATTLAKIDDILANTNVYTAEAYATFGEAKLAAQNAYDNGTWTNEEALAYGSTVFGTGWHTSNTIDDLLLSAFDVHGGDYDHGYYINTWSIEGDNDGSGFTTPFIEYWTGDGEVLADNTIHAQMTGLEPGVYTVTALVRQHLSNQFAEDTEVTGLGLGVCSWEVIPSTGAINIAGTRFFMETIEASGEVFADGVLDINFIVNSANCSWVSIKNVKFEKTDAPTGIKSLDVEEEGTLKDGKYFIKDKIVIVKNGKMYNAAGGLQK